MQGHPRQWVIVKSYYKTWITGGGSGNPLHYPCCKNPNNGSVQLLSCVWLFATPWTAACQTSLSITNSQSMLKLLSMESVKPTNHLILCHPLLHLPSVFPSIRVFSNESALPIWWPKYWSFSFSISPSNEYSGIDSVQCESITLIDTCILKNPCIPGLYQTWSWCMSFMMCCWILFAKTLLRIFASMFISDIDL